MTITCPRSGLAFETQATTNTRCRRCKSVVRVGSGPAHRPQRGEVPAPDVPAGWTSMLIVAALGIFLFASYVLPPLVRAVRRRRADSSPVAAEIGHQDDASRESWEDEDAAI